MERVVLVLILFNFIGSYSQKVDGFTLVRDHVLAHGKELIEKKEKGKCTITSLELTTVVIKLEYVVYGKKEQIIITHLVKEPKLPKYMVVKEDNALKFSAYYSRLDTEEDLLKREDDWELLVYEVEASKVTKHLLELLETGNSYYAERKWQSASWAYRKFVDLMKAEGLEDQVPKMVKTRMFYCRYRKN